MEMAFTVRLLLLIIPSFFVVPISVFSQTDGRVAVGAYLSATAANNSSWFSPSGHFAFGFRQLENKDMFLLSIWYAKIPDRTIVWYANGDSPVAPKGSLVNLTANDGLVLSSPQGQQLWKSEISGGVVAFGVLIEIGNFVLEDDNSESLWETFKNLTHANTYTIPWKCMISGFTIMQHRFDFALLFYFWMLGSGVSPSKYSSFPPVIKPCGGLNEKLSRAVFLFSFWSKVYDSILLMVFDVHFRV